MTPSHVYVVRIWQASQGPDGFRAAVRSVEREEASLMSSAEELAAFFARCTDPLAADAAAVRGTGAAAGPTRDPDVG